MGKYNSHKIYLNDEGEEVPSVTTILSILNKPALTKWANIMGFKRQRVENILQRSADIGTMVHNCLECYLQGKKYELPKEYETYKNDLVARLDGFLTWYKKNTLVPMKLEYELVSKRYGGTCDFYGKLNDEDVVLDFKTSSNVYGSMFLQLAAYTLVLESQGHNVDAVVVIHIKEGKTVAHYMKREKLEPYVGVFQCLVELFHNWFDLSKTDGWGDIIGK